MHPWVRRLATTFFARTGYHVLPQWRLDEWAFASHLRELLTSLRIDLVLDVGANVGQYRDFLREHVQYDGAIVSFEPLATNVEILAARAKDDSRWTVQPYALGRQAGVQQFNRMARTTFSSFLAPDPGATAGVLQNNSVVAVESVATRTLADIWPELRQTHGGFRPYLKMDTQGYDLEVLAGGESILPEVLAAQSELYFRPVYMNAPTALESFRAFDRLGFAVAGLFPVSHDPGMQLRACDCTLVNRAAGQ